MAATRFLTAGIILFTWAIVTRQRLTASRSQWTRAFIIGGLLLLCGNGGVTWSEKHIASGLTALLVATEPLWVVIFNWLLGHKRPNAKVWLGVLVGLVGVGLLVSGEFGFDQKSSGALLGAVVVVVSALAWAGGSVYANHHPINASTAVASGMQMLAGGSLLLVASLVSGDFKKLSLASASWVSIGALSYLVIFGSLIAFTAYSWLLRNVAPAQAATYAYVNPVVAVLLGWLIASEPVRPLMLVAAAIIVGSVVLITTYSYETRAETKKNREDDSCAPHPCA
jgi:drug/metabolite transporter (DMT)-like permease